MNWMVDLGTKKFCFVGAFAAVDGLRKKQCGKPARRGEGAEEGRPLTR